MPVKGCMGMTTTSSSNAPQSPNKQSQSPLPQPNTPPKPEALQIKVCVCKWRHRLRLPRRNTLCSSYNRLGRTHLTSSASYDHEEAQRFWSVSQSLIHGKAKQIAPSIPFTSGKRGQARALVCLRACFPILAYNSPSQDIS